MEKRLFSVCNTLLHSDILRLDLLLGLKLVNGKNKITYLQNNHWGIIQNTVLARTTYLHSILSIFKTGKYCLQIRLMKVHKTEIDLLHSTGCVGNITDGRALTKVHVYNKH